MRSRALLVLLPLLVSVSAELLDFSSELKIEDVLADKYGQCPIPRICFTGGYGCDLNNTDVTVVNCTHRQAGPYVPIFTTYYISARTWQFDFSDNYISVLEDTSFYTADPISPIPINLTRLVLSRNYIHTISPKTFTGDVSKQLTYLDLSHNILTSLDEGVFSDMPVLETLDLSYNRLRYIDTMCSVTLPRIQVINLENNRLTYLSDNCYGSTRLKNSGRLSLKNNQIVSVNDCSYKGVRNVDLSNNPVICGCSNRFSGKQCMKREAENSFALSTQPTCYKTDEQCDEFNITVIYTNGKSRDWYTISVGFTSATQYDSVMFQVGNLDQDSDDSSDDESEADFDISALNITVVAEAKNTNNVTSIEAIKYQRNNNYFLCASQPGKEYARKCVGLYPPRAPYFSAADTVNVNLTCLLLLSLAWLFSF